MPTYRFEFYEEMARPGIFAEMENDEAALKEALLAAKETMLDGIIEGTDPTSWVTKVYDAAGYLIATIQFSDIVAPPATDPSEAEPGTPDEGTVMRSG